MILDLLIRLVAFTSPISVIATQIIYIALFVSLIYGIFKGRYSLARNHYFIIILAIIAITSIITIFTGNYELLFQEYTMAFLPFTFFLGYYIYSRPRLQGMIFWLLIGGAFIGIWGILGQLIRKNLVDYGNMMALIAIIGIFSLLFRLYRSKREEIIYLVATTIIILALIFSFRWNTPSWGYIIAENSTIMLVAMSILYLRLIAEQIYGIYKKSGLALMGFALSIALFITGIMGYNIFGSQISMLFWLISGMLIAAQQEITRKNV
jgi:hypothetical protein